MTCSYKTQITGKWRTAILLCAAALVTASCVSTAPPSELACSGTEPFWSLKLSEGSANWSDMAGDQRSYALSDPVPGKTSSGRWQIAGRNADTGTPIAVSLTRTDQCSDGMSDFTYAWEITTTFDQTSSFHGCCGRIENGRK